ncbi:zinc metallopeptidase, partial [Metarhizium majus ARSEF 297]
MRPSKRLHRPRFGPSFFFFFLFFLITLPLSTDFRDNGLEGFYALLFAKITCLLYIVGWNNQHPMSPHNSITENGEPSMPNVGEVVEKYRPRLEAFSNFYKEIHQDPEVSGVESRTAERVAKHLESLRYQVHQHIGGHGVVGVFRNGPGKVILLRAELDALPIEELTDLPYSSKKRMVDRYGNDRPVMHACGHDMNMVALLGAAALLRAAAAEWSVILLIVFQPDEEETGGAKAMIDDGLYNLVPVPDLMLAQHVVPSATGSVSIRSGPVLVAADSIRVRAMCGSYPAAMRVVLGLEDALRAEIGPGKDVTVACWGFHAGEPGNDYVAYADILLDVKTMEAKVRPQVHEFNKRRFREACREAGTPREPIIDIKVRAPLTSNDVLIADAVGKVFKEIFGDNALEMELTRACEDFSTLGGGHNVPYAYWNFGGSGNTTGGAVATNHFPYFSPIIESTLRTGIDAMALVVLTFLASMRRANVTWTRDTPPLPIKSELLVGWRNAEAGLTSTRLRTEVVENSENANPSMIGTPSAPP